jgi:hypothetical protein
MAVRKEAEEAIALLIKAKRGGDPSLESHALAKLGALGFKIEPRRSGYVWRV